jgi:hypothetical protein
LLYRNFDINIGTFAAEHLTSARRASLDIATPMVQMAILCSAIRTPFTWVAPTFLAKFLPEKFLAVAENISD